MKLRIHYKTLKKIVSKVLDNCKVPTRTLFYSHSLEDCKIGNYETVIDNTLKPTIDNGDWVFPKDRFIEYEEKDEEWCRYFGIGQTYKGPYVEGEIYIDDKLNEKPIIRDNHRPKRSFYYDPNDLRFEKQRNRNK